MLVFRFQYSISQPQRQRGSPAWNAAAFCFFPQNMVRCCEKERLQDDCRSVSWMTTAACCSTIGGKVGVAFCVREFTAHQGKKAVDERLFLMSNLPPNPRRTSWFLSNFCTKLPQEITRFVETCRLKAVESRIEAVHGIPAGIAAIRQISGWISR